MWIAIINFVIVLRHFPSMNSIMSHEHLYVMGNKIPLMISTISKYLYNNILLGYVYMVIY